MLIEEIDLVQHVDLRLVEGVQLAQHRLYLRHLLGSGGTGGVGDLEQNGRALHLLQRGAEGGDQRGGQVANEAHGVGEQHLAARRQGHGAQGWIEGGKHARAFDDARRWSAH